MRLSRPLGTGKFKMKGRLIKTGRRVKPVRVPVRQIFRDDAGQEWVKAFGKWWKFPEEIEY